MNADIGVPIGYWPASAHISFGHFLEAWIDELAHAAGNRDSANSAWLLQDQPRHRADAATGAGSGLATASRCRSGMTHGIALAEALARFRAGGRVSADKRNRSNSAYIVVAIVGFGQPDTVRQQIEGSVVFGLGARLCTVISRESGRAGATNQLPVIISC